MKGLMIYLNMIFFSTLKCWVLPSHFQPWSSTNSYLSFILLLFFYSFFVPLRGVALEFRCTAVQWQKRRTFIHSFIHSFILVLFHHLLEVSVSGFIYCPLGNMNVDRGFSTSRTGNLHVVQWEALVRSSFWKEPHACTMEKVSVMQLYS